MKEVVGNAEMNGVVNSDYLNFLSTVYIASSYGRVLTLLDFCI